MPRWFAALFLSIGFVVLIVAGLVYRHGRAFTARAERAEAEVIDVAHRGPRPGEQTGTYASVLRFVTRSGRVVEARASVRSSSPRHRVGQRVRVLYDPLRPEAPVIDSFMDRHFLLIVLVPIGLGFSAFGLPVLVAGALRQRKEARLKQQGLPIEATLTGVIRLRNGFQPWRITAESVHPLTGERVSLQSRNLYDDPAPNVRVGQTVRAWIDPNRPERHWVDVSFLPGVRG